MLSHCLPFYVLENGYKCFDKMNADDKLEELRRREVIRNVPLVCCVVVILLLGIIGNAFSFAYYGFRRKLTVTNFLIASLAANDLIANLIFCDELPIMFRSFDYRDKAGCKTIFFLNNWVMINSVLMLAVIAVDRQRRICRPFSNQLSLRAAFGTIIGMATVTFCLTLREVFLADIITKPILMNDNSTIYGYFCSHTKSESTAGIIKASHLINITIFCAAVIVIVVAYSLVARHIVKTRNALFIGSFKRSSNSYLHIASIFSDANASRETRISGNGIAEKCQDVNETKECENVCVIAVNDNVCFIEDQKVEYSSETVASTHDTPFKSTRPTNGSAVELNKTNALSEERGARLSVSPQLSNVNRDSFRSDLTGRSYQAEKRVTKMIVVFTIASIMSFVPYFGVMLFVPRHISTEENLSNMGKKIARQFYMLSCVVNPYVMCGFNERFRQFIISCICKRTCKHLEHSSPAKPVGVNHPS